jgi:radical SAM protein with 4Fe4S-binding SPASM domain
MIPDIKCDTKTMSSETFKKMLEITERLFDNGIYDKAHFRLSGGEPFIVFNNYKDIVTEYRNKYPKQMTFGILTNFVKFNDEIADWMELNNIGMQVSLDDLVNSKPLANGESSSELVLKNIQKLQTRNIGFSLNTVLDIEKTKDLTKLANFVSSFKNIEWGLNASYTEDDPNKIDEVIKIFDDCIFQLVKKGFDIYHKLRFYNTVVGDGRGGCSAGVNSFAIGTNLEVWPCQSLCNKEKLSYFDENIKQTLMTSLGNSYFRERQLRPECSDCPILGQCRGGCRATHDDDDINDVVCQIRRNIIGKLTNGYYTQNNQCHTQPQNNQCQCNDHSIDNILNDYISKLPEMKDIMLVETPDLE